MPAPLQNAVASLFASLQGAAGAAVEYTQSTTTVAVNAVPGRTSVEAEFADGSVRTDKLMDFVISINDLQLTPTKGDTVVWGTRQFEVMHPAGGKVFEEVGPYRQLYRIHTKEVYAG